MARPSIFSREYKRKMRLRKMKISLLVVLVILGLSGFATRRYGKDWINNNIQLLKNNYKKEKTTTPQEIIKEQVPVIEDKPKIVEEVSPSPKVETNIEVDNPEKFYQVKLSGDRTINIIYEDNNGDKRIKLIPDGNNLYYNISPEGKSVVILDNGNQSMILVNSSGEARDITKKNYISSRESGSVTYEKDAQLKKTPNYIWCDSPKFIDENMIVYISQLPWFGRTSKYVWYFDIKNNIYKQIQGIEGESIKFNNLSEQGLEVDVDGRAIHILPDGRFVRD